MPAADYTLTDGTQLSLLDAVEALQGICQACGRGGRGEPGRGDYVRLRQALMAEPNARDLLPEFIQRHRSLDQLWPILGKAGGYQDRDRFVWDGFRPLLDTLEASLSPAAQTADEILGDVSEAWVERHWRKALERRHQDPEGAITAARSFLEDVCRHVLDECGEQHDGPDDLQALYKKAAKALNLGADQHDRQDLKQILSGCNSVVSGFAAVRNRMGDAHGSGKPLRPRPRHAVLAINLAGTMASFLLTTLAERQTQGGP